MHQFAHSQSQSTHFKHTNQATWCHSGVEEETHTIASYYVQFQSRLTSFAYHPGNIVSRWNYMAPHAAKACLNTTALFPDNVIAHQSTPLEVVVLHISDIA